MKALDVLDTYFIENRSRLLDIAAFLDRLDRYEGASAARADFRYRAFMKVLSMLSDRHEHRTAAIQLALSDPTTEPLDVAGESKAFGAWPGA